MEPESALSLSLFRKMSSSVSQGLIHSMKAKFKSKQRTTASVHGSLQHITIVYPHSHHHLPSLSLFESKFPNYFIIHHIPRACLNNLLWWSHVLAKPNPSHTLVILPEIDLDVWVDASSPWGIGILVNNKWAAWKLINGWDSASRDISWAEAIAIKMAVMWLSSNRFQNCAIKIKCDNSSVINSFWKGRSHNFERNQSLIHITALLAASNLMINLCYIPSVLHKANSLSRGVAGANGLCLVPHVPVPEPLCAFLEPV